jgi:hypothetical protein
MPKQTPTDAALEAAQIDAILTALAEQPGSTAYTVGLRLPFTRITGQAARSAPMTLTLRLLGQLQDAGRVRSERNPRGARWYLTGQPEETPDA